MVPGCYKWKMENSYFLYINLCIKYALISCLFNILFGISFMQPIKLWGYVKLVQTGWAGDGGCCVATYVCVDWSKPVIYCYFLFICKKGPQMVLWLIPEAVSVFCLCPSVCLSLYVFVFSVLCSLYVSVFLYLSVSVYVGVCEFFMMLSFLVSPSLCLILYLFLCLCLSVCLSVVVSVSLCSWT